MKIRRNFFVSAICKTGIFLFLGFGLFLFALPSVQAGIADHLVINEVATAGTSSYDDWAELYNPTGSDIDLTGWSLQKSTSGGTVTRSDLSGIIPAGGYFLVARNNASTDQNLKDMADLLSDNFALADNNALYLVNSNINIDPDDVGAVFVDAVGWGGIIYGEGIAYPTNVSANKSLSRSSDGEDTDDNSVDFVILDTPTMENSGNGSGGQEVNGDVLVTIYPDTEPVQSIISNSASIVFQVNSDGDATVEYGFDDNYGSSSAETVVTANTDVFVNLINLKCDTTYHYRINASNFDDSDSYQTTDATFTTLPCGINVDSLVMTRSGARANDNYDEGWEWQFDITVWNTLETELKMKFDIWNGVGALATGNNMRYSIDSGATWIDILADDAYPAVGADISTIDESGDAGRQVSILVQMKVPVGTLAGSYGSSYGILTE